MKFTGTAVILAKASPAGKPDSKQVLFTQILPALRGKHLYFTRETIRSSVEDAGVNIKDSSLQVYLSEAVKRGVIHDAGRGWYSGLDKPLALTPEPIAKLTRLVRKAFPLLDFTVWSTTQLNPWMRHLLARPVTLLHAPADTLEALGENLRVAGWNAAINPTPSNAAKLVRPDEKMVVLRPTLSREPPGKANQAPVEKILVDLLVETPLLALMDESEAIAVVNAALRSGLAQVAAMQTYAKHRKLAKAILGKIEPINHLRQNKPRGVA